MMKRNICKNVNENNGLNFDVIKLGYCIVLFHTFYLALRFYTIFIPVVQYVFLCIVCVVKITFMVIIAEWYLRKSAI